jgi:hypothetical protein
MAPSRFTGVSWDKDKGKWRAQIFEDCKKNHLGYFVDEKDAARGYDAGAARIGRPMSFPAANSDVPAVVEGRCGGT